MSVHCLLVTIEYRAARSTAHPQTLKHLKKYALCIYCQIDGLTCAHLLFFCYYFQILNGCLLGILQ